MTMKMQDEYIVIEPHQSGKSNELPEYIGFKLPQEFAFLQAWLKGEGYTELDCKEQKLLLVLQVIFAFDHLEIYGSWAKRKGKSKMKTEETRYLISFEQLEKIYNQSTE